MAESYPSDLPQICPQCQESIEQAMSFCIHCGHHLTESNQANSSLPRAICPACGAADNLSQQFCIQCGASMSKLDSPASQSTIVSTAQPNKPVNALVHKKAVISRSSNHFVVAAIACGLAVGILLAFLAQKSGFQSLLAQTKWPKQGLVIYATPAEADVTIEERTGRRFTVGRTGKSGALSLNNLPEGIYRLTLKAANYMTVEKDFQISKESKLVVLGFPERIELPKAK